MTESSQSVPETGARREATGDDRAGAEDGAISRPTGTSVPVPVPGRAAKAERRRARILQLLSAPDVGNVRNQDLAAELGVSIATVRRDLTDLQHRRAVARTYGGASIAPGQGQPTPGGRGVRAVQQKRAIARAAVAMLGDGDLVILDAGSTAEQLAIAINNELSLTVVTNGIRAINRLAVQDRVQVMVLGGYLRGANGTISGGEAEAMVERVRGDFAFLGAVSVSPRRGVASLTYDQARLKSIMMHQAKQVFVIADSSKLLADDTYSYWSQLPAHWGLVTDDGAEREVLDALAARGADPIVVVPVDGAEEKT